MKITLTWTPTGSLPMNFIICDSPANTTLNNFTVNGEHLFQEAQFFRASTRQFYDRGNEATIITFTASRGWTDQVTADSYLLNYNSLFPRQANVTFMSTNGSKAATLYLVNAIIYPARNTLRGMTTFHEHQLKGQLISTTNS